MKSITVIDYGVGNIRNVIKALDFVGYRVTFTNHHHIIEQSDRLLLPGVGAFQPAMKRLESLQLTSTIKHHAEQGKPLLGICLGMQLLCKSSTEFGYYEGLGLLDSDISEFTDVPKNPHMGWNQLHITNPDDTLFKNVTSNESVYFVHSFKASLSDQTAAKTDYFGEFSSILKHDNIVGMQFHPEKSQKTGLQLLKNFGEI